jgi:predicted phage terminase large subunit-like protein
MEENLTPEEYRMVLRRDYYTFIQRCFVQLNPQTEFLPNWHIEVMAAKLEACRQGKIRRLIINLPPRHLKSLCASVAFPAWCLGHNPAAQVLCVSYAQDLADKLARDCRSVMASAWYQSLFATRLSALKQAIQEFVTTQQGYRMATSVGGVLTGRGADLIIIDDPLKPDEALSEAQRRAVNNWYDNTLYSRLNNKNTGCIILIMQRLHEDDLVGHVEDQEEWEVVRFPAIAEQHEEHSVQTVFGPRWFRRLPGEVLHPERESGAALDRIRQTIGEYNFAGQYQQAPAPLGGGLVKKEWFNSYEQVPEKFEQIVQSWDTANKPSELSDYSVCTTWGLKDRRIYLLHVLRKRMDYPDLKRRVREQAQAFQATIVLIEDKASGTQLIQELIAERMYSIKRYVPEGDKVMRLHSQTATIENGFVYLPREAPWLSEYLHELTTFPNAKFDDQADSTSQALAWIKQAGSEAGIITYYRLEGARHLHMGGLPIAAAAGRFDLAPEQLQRWVDDHKRKQSELVDERNRILYRNPCAKCGKDIGFNVSYLSSGALSYHQDCWRKSMFGL